MRKQALKFLVATIMALLALPAGAVPVDAAVSDGTSAGTLLLLSPLLLIAGVAVWVGAAFTAPSRTDSGPPARSPRRGEEPRQGG